MTQLPKDVKFKSWHNWFGKMKNTHLGHAPQGSSASSLTNWKQQKWSQSKKLAKDLPCLSCPSRDYLCCTDHLTLLTEIKWSNKESKACLWQPHCCCCLQGRKGCPRLSFICHISDNFLDMPHSTWLIQTETLETAALWYEKSYG